MRGGRAASLVFVGTRPTATDRLVETEWVSAAPPRRGLNCGGGGAALQSTVARPLVLAQNVALGDGPWRDTGSKSDGRGR